MRDKRLISAILGLISTLAVQVLWCSSASADDFRFLVPYRFEGIRANVNWIGISCTAWSDSSGASALGGHDVSLQAIEPSESGYKSVSGFATILLQGGPAAESPAAWRCWIRAINYTRADGTSTLGAQTQTGTVEEILYRDRSNIFERGEF